jgi:hypothetical protein
MPISEWVRLPSAWIDAHGLADLPWKSGGEGSDNTAALMALIVITHAVDQDTGIARVTYDHICNGAGLSRAKLSNGLDVLKKIKVIEEQSRSTYRLANFGEGGRWAKIPAKSMYSVGRIAAFADFQLRRAAELDALKLFFLFAARRGSDTNRANIGYEKIEQYTGIKKARIKTGISFLASLSLVYVEQVPSKTNSFGVSSAYRLVGLDSYNHMGTKGRGNIQEETAPVDYTPNL